MYCGQIKSEELLHEIILAIGYFTVNNPEHQVGFLHNIKSFRNCSFDFLLEDKTGTGHTTDNSAVTVHTTIQLFLGKAPYPHTPAYTDMLLLW